MYFRCYNNISVKKITPILNILTTTFFCTVLAITCSAQPYGKGVYNSNIPYGNLTSLSIGTSGNIDIPITPTSDGVLATGNSTITVTSTDITGYKLYIRSLNSTSMNNLGAQLPTSNNVTPAPLAIDTWGYNTDASIDFIGINLTDTLIRSTNSPVPNGEATNVTYGINLDMAKPAGNYTATVVYTAVPQTD